MIASNPLTLILILLAAAVLVVAIFRQFKLSPVLGYLVAGAVIGPHGFRVIADVEELTVIAELGVVFLLFIIGTELSFDRMLRMGKQVFGVGGAQVLLTALAIGGACLLSGLGYSAALVIGAGLALSSTALVMQILEERRKQATPLGRMSLAVLLMQDLAVVPLLVLVPLLDVSADTPIREALLEAGVKAAIAFSVVLVGGRLFLRPLFRSVAALEVTELFSAFTLLVVLGIAWAFHAQGLSMPLGAFVAGLLVAETEYKHQVEADILPYKGLLLGFFFMVVGMNVDFALLINMGGQICSLVALLMMGKTMIIAVLCRMAKLPWNTALHTGLLLSQGGEFAFIVFQMGGQFGVISDTAMQLLMVVVTLSMALTPFAFSFGSWLSKKLAQPVMNQTDALPDMSETVDWKDHVVIVGYGRVGQIIGKLLAAEGISYVALDTDAFIVTKGRERGRPVYYGDGARREVLQAVSLELARAAVVTTHDFYSANKIVVALKNLASSVPVIARSRDLQHLQKLEMAGADIAIAEKFEASLQLGGAVMKRMGVPDHEISRVIDLFREHDYALTRKGEVSRESSIIA